MMIMFTRFNNYLENVAPRDLIAALIALILTLTIVALLVYEKSVPNELWSALTLILGYYFGAAYSKKE